MTWSFSAISNVPTATQSGTDASLASLATAITAVPTVARSTVYAAGVIVKPPTPNGMWYRCSVGGTTAVLENGSITAVYETPVGKSSIVKMLDL